LRPPGLVATVTMCTTSGDDRAQLQALNERFIAACQTAARSARRSGRSARGWCPADPLWNIIRSSGVIPDEPGHGRSRTSARLNGRAADRSSNGWLYKSSSWARIDSARGDRDRRRRVMMCWWSTRILRSR
jgi:hypothetical protein